MFVLLGDQSLYELVKFLANIFFLFKLIICCNDVIYFKENLELLKY